MKKLTTFLALLICAAAQAAIVIVQPPEAGGGGGNPSYTATHYVAPYASVAGATSDMDTANGPAYSTCTTISAPCTAAEVMASATAGDQVEFAPGIYSLTANTGGNQDQEPALYPTNSGTSGNPIVFFARNRAVANQGNASAITELRTDAANNSSGSPVIGTYGQDYITWDGFKIDVQYAHGVEDSAPIYFSGQGTLGVKALGNWLIGETILNSEWVSNWGAIRLDRTIDGYEVADNYIQDFRHQTLGKAIGVLTYNAINGEIHHNTIENTDEGIGIKGIYPDAQAYNGVPGSIHHNRLIGPSGGGTYAFYLAYVAGASGTLDIYQNIATGYRFGIRLQGWGSENTSGPVPRHFRFVNDTFYDLGDNFPEAMIYGSDLDEATHLENTVFQNIIWQEISNRQMYLSYASTDNFDTEPTHAYNVYAGYSGSSTFYTANTTNRDYDWWVANVESTAENFDPQMTDPANGDFSITPGGNAEDAGVDLLNLLGNGTSGAINIGADIGNGDTIGYRQ